MADQSKETGQTKENKMKKYWKIFVFIYSLPVWIFPIPILGGAAIYGVFDYEWQRTDTHMSQGRIFAAFISTIVWLCLIYSK